MVYWRIVSNGIDKQMANVTRNVKLDDEVYGYGFIRESLDRQCMRLLGFTLNDADLTWDSGGETCDIAKMVAVEGYVYCSFGAGPWLTQRVYAPFKEPMTWSTTRIASRRTLSIQRSTSTRFRALRMV